MTPQQMLADLIDKRKKIDIAIAGIEQLATGERKRGRPSKATMEARRISGKPVRAGKSKRPPKTRP